MLLVVSHSRVYFILSVADLEIILHQVKGNVSDIEA